MATDNSVYIWAHFSGPGEEILTKQRVLRFQNESKDTPLSHAMNFQGHSYHCRIKPKKYTPKYGNSKLEKCSSYSRADNLIVRGTKIHTSTRGQWIFEVPVVNQEKLVIWRGDDKLWHGEATNIYVRVHNCLPTRVDYVLSCGSEQTSNNRKALHLIILLHRQSKPLPFQVSQHVASLQKCVLTMSLLNSVVSRLAVTFDE